MITRRILLGSVCCLAAGAAAVQAQAPTKTVRVKGTVEKFDGSMLAVKAPDGSTSNVMLAEKYRLRTVANLTAADLKPGDYIGVGAKPQPDGTLRAIQITRFPEAQRGVGEGHRSWRSDMPGDTMTNGTVATTIKNANGPTLTVTYKGGEKKLIIPADCRIITYKSAEKSDLKPGAEVLITAQKHADGTLAAATVTVSTKGVALPI